uniref:Uncharacterized protein n=1 Tax=Bicosoecida sp. CB-2014 TaxID=1486930 RepID=A0A7S1CCU8_9STRA|mmetsp:Transcript_22155/g.77651  ORF Transcript_22155/g.77651 Transcript_22155/m.77651 type:complete len:548 (+) Transcript_22155:534-2177(+)
MASGRGGRAGQEPWTPAEREALRAAVIEHGESQWDLVMEDMASYGRTPEACRRFWQSSNPIVKGAWAPEEDALLVELLARVGDDVKVWGEIAGHVPGRNAKQCRERWVNNLDPTVNKGPWTEAEDRALVAAQAELGNKWSAIAERLPGRPDNAVKNRWYCMLNRQSVPRTPSRRAARRAAVAAAAAAAEAAAEEEEDDGADVGAGGGGGGVAVEPSEAPAARGGAGGGARRRTMHRRSRSAPETLTFVLDALQPELMPRQGAAMAVRDDAAGDGAGGASDVAAAAVAELYASKPVENPLADVEGVGDSPTAIRELLAGIEGHVKETTAETAAKMFGLGRRSMRPTALGGALADLGSLQGGYESPSLEAQMHLHLASHYQHDEQAAQGDGAGFDGMADDSESTLSHATSQQAHWRPDGGHDDMMDDAAAPAKRPQAGGSDFASGFDDDDETSASRSGSFVTYDDDMLQTAFELQHSHSPQAAGGGDDDMGEVVDALFGDHEEEGKHGGGFAADAFDLGVGAHLHGVSADDIVLHNAEDPFDYAEVCEL